MKLYNARSGSIHKFAAVAFIFFSNLHREKRHTCPGAKSQFWYPQIYPSFSTCRHGYYLSTHSNCFLLAMIYCFPFACCGPLKHRVFVLLKDILKQHIVTEPANCLKDPSAAVLCGGGEIALGLIPHKCSFVQNSPEELKLKHNNGTKWLFIANCKMLISTSTLG